MAPKFNVSKYLSWIVFSIALLALLALNGLIADGGFYDYKTWKELLQNLIPEFIGPLVSFSIIYLMFSRLGINIEEILKRGENETEWLKKGYETFDDIDWHPYFTNSSKLVLIAFFFEDWIQDNEKSFSKFLSKKESRLVVYLPNYNNAQLMKEVSSLIPEYTPEQLIQKIKDSIKGVKDRMENKTTQDIAISLYDKVFNYTLQIFDKEMILSINQLRRDKKFKSPFIVFDLARSPSLDSFYSGEVKTLEKLSKTINLNEWHS